MWSPQVDDDGKVKRLRKECRNKSCTAATFMAMHYDRFTCGRCGMTLVFQGDE
jgi:small subunit ribosomal protein S27Ae